MRELNIDVLPGIRKPRREKKSYLPPLMELVRWILPEIRALRFKCFDVCRPCAMSIPIRKYCMLDDMDLKILAVLQVDCTLAVADVGKQVGLSTTPCWRRIQRLEEAGVIRSRIALLDPAKINVGVTVFVSIKTDTHSLDWLTRFHAAVVDFPEVVEFYRMSGDVDYLLRVVVPDIAAYDAFYKRLIARIELSKVSSAFAMEQIKYTTALPLSFVPRTG
jgi:Lrp/AsnC family transcriptional regulator